MASQKPPLPNWLRPLWVRILFVVIPAVWAGVEFYAGAQMWGVLFGAVALWGGYPLLYDYRPDDQDPPS
jgi:hypothetical protein